TSALLASLVLLSSHGAQRHLRPSPTRRSSARVEMGEAATPSLIYHLKKTHSKNLQPRLPEVLVRIGRALPSAQRNDLQLDLGIAMRRTRDLDAAAVMLWAIRELRPGRSS